MGVGMELLLFLLVTVCVCVFIIVFCFLVCFWGGGIFVLFFKFLKNILVLIQVYNIFCVSDVWKYCTWLDLHFV